MKKLIILFGALFFLTNTSNATIYFVNQSIGNDTNNGLFQTQMAFADGPVQTINAALSLYSSGDTIVVSEGDYYEQISITKPVVMYGARAIVKPLSSNRGGETRLYPQTIDVSAGPNTNNVQVWILSDSVEINGFILDGNNPSLTSGENIFGVDVDLSYGIVVGNDFNHVHISYNIFENYYYSFVYAWGGSVITKDHSIHENYMTNCGLDAIYAESDMYFNIVNNIVYGVPSCLKVTNYNQSSKLTFNIDNNLFTANDFGITISDLSAAGNFVVSNNEIYAQDPFSTFVGVNLNNNEANAGYSFSNNTLEGGNTGYLMTNTKNKHITFKNDSINNTDFGIYSISTQSDIRQDTLTLDGVKIYNSREKAVSIISDNYLVTLRTPGVKIKNAKVGNQLTGNVNWIPTNCSFESCSEFYIRIDSSNTGKRLATDISALSCTFNGLTGAGMSIAQAFAAEDKIHHYLDDNSLGFITIKTNNIYITLVDGNNLVTPAMSKAKDGWHIHNKPVVSAEAVNITKNLTFYTYGYTELGMLTMAGAGKTLTLVGDLHLSQGLTLNDGIIKSSVGNAPRIKENGIVMGGNDRSYVDGILYRKGLGATTDTLVYPIGKGSDYRPSRMVIDYSQASGVVEYSMEVFNSALGFTSKDASLKNISKLRHWEPKLYGSAFISNIQYQVNFSNTFSDDQVTDGANLRLAGLSLGKLKDLGGVASSVPTGSIENTSVLTKEIMKITLANNYGGTNLLGNNGPIAAFDAENICLGNALSLSSNSIDPFNSLNAWRWDFGVSAVQDDTALGASVVYNYADTGVYQVTLVVRNVFGQTDTIKRTVIVADVPQVSFDYVSNCFPDFVEFDGNASVKKGGIATYEWDINGSNFNVEDVNFAFAGPGTYDAKLKVTSGFGCADSVEQQVLYGDLPNVVLAPRGLIYICEGDTVTINSVNSHNAYTWNDASTGTFVRKATTGEVILKANSANNCFAYDTAFVNVVPLPVVSAGNDTVIYKYSRAFLKASGATNYLWRPNTTLSDSMVANPVAKPITKTTYAVIGIDDFGCIGMDSVTVDIKIPLTIKVPNLLTPNKDGHNDVWDLRDVPGIDNSKVTILDKWGALVYESPASGYKHNWAGSSLNIEYPEGTYYYIIELKDYNETLKGALLLVR